MLSGSGPSWLRAGLSLWRGGASSPGRGRVSAAGAVQPTPGQRRGVTATPESLRARTEEPWAQSWPQLQGLGPQTRAGGGCAPRQHRPGAPEVCACVSRGAGLPGQRLRPVDVGVPRTRVHVRVMAPERGLWAEDGLRGLTAGPVRAASERPVPRAAERAVRRRQGRWAARGVGSPGAGPVGRARRGADRARGPAVHAYVTRFVKPGRAS